MIVNLSGYITKLNDKTFTVMGVPIDNWRALNESYWSDGVCRHVSKDKKKCTIRINDITEFIKNGTSVRPDDITGCYVKIATKIRKYNFTTLGGGQKHGWVITATKVTKTNAPLQ
jgi:hypothetical protein